MFNAFIRYYHTVKHLRWRQIAYRLFYQVRRPPRIALPQHACRKPRIPWDGPCVSPQSLFDDDRVRLLNEEGSIAEAGDWNDPSRSKLWLYHLHYFDDLNVPGSTARGAAHSRLLHRWIAENPIGVGIGWDPYPTSLRLVNWIKWVSREEPSDDVIVRSIAQQTDALTRQIEYHILGNHLIANAKALVFAGVFLAGERGPKSLRTGLGILRNEVREQFLGDGGHFELSPMYHAIMLWDLLDLIYLARLSTIAELRAESDGWEKRAIAAIGWLRTMTHPDGEIGFFNDSAIGMAPSPGQVFEYARSLGLEARDDPACTHTLLRESGYSRVTMNKHVLLIDHGAVGPAYQPGHAHAETLSVEWSVGRQRVLVNSGTSLYGSSAERLRQRQTAAHNTVVVDGLDSSEVWGGFRVARRAAARLEKAEFEEGGFNLILSHTGYMRLPGRVTHERRINTTDSTLQVTDHLSGRFTHAEAFYHIHPDVAVIPIDRQHCEMRLPGGALVLVDADSTITIEDATWHPQFGLSMPNKRLKVAIEGDSARTTFRIKRSAT